jgi:hypothetical protein
MIDHEVRRQSEFFRARHCWRFGPLVLARCVVHVILANVHLRDRAARYSECFG